MPFSTKRKQDFLEKWLTPGLGMGEQKPSVSENRTMLYVDGTWKGAQFQIQDSLSIKASNRNGP